jgi:hypothetical protein
MIVNASEKSRSTAAVALLVVRRRELRRPVPVGAELEGWRVSELPARPWLGVCVCCAKTKDGRVSETKINATRACENLFFTAESLYKV